MSTTMGILHLRPRLPSHTLPSTTTPSTRLILGRSGTSFRPLPDRKMQTGTALLRLVSRCAADGAREPIPEEDPRTSRFCEQTDNFVMEHMAALRAQGRKVKEIEVTLFGDEVAQLLSYMPEIDSNPLLLYDKATELAGMVSLRALMAIRVCLKVTANAHLRVDESSEMSPDTVKQIIRTYVWTFLKAAEDASHRKVDMTVVVSFIDALRGLAAISHILFEDTLAVVNNIEDSSWHYSPGYDVEALNNDVQCNIKELVKGLKTVPEKRAYELLPSTLSNATLQVFEFVRLVLDLRHKALAHAQARSNKDKRNK